MNPDVIAGLQVTGLGMGLVFLTLILIMLVIMALGRLFRPTLEEEGAAVLVAETPKVPAASLAVQPAASDTDQVAAIAVAIAVARQAAAKTPEAVLEAPEINYDGIAGEVISVIRVEPGPSNWGQRGRISALS